MGAAAVSQTASAQTSAAGGRPLTFARDVAPIFQEKCEVCHRPGNIGPMSLVTYEEVRPWLRSIKARVAGREMPPWHLDKGVGIQKFINDRSLSDAQIDTIVRWVDTGAPRGDMKDMPPPKQWPSGDRFFLEDALGPPDLVVQAKRVHDAGAGARRPLRSGGGASADRAAMGPCVRDEALAEGPPNRPPRQHVSDSTRRRRRRSRLSGRCGPDSLAPTW